MPVIAFNASAQVAEWYNDIKKGKRSKILNGRLEQAIRLTENDSVGLKSYAQYELQVQELQDNIVKLQEILIREINKNPVVKKSAGSKIKKLLKWITRRNKRAIID